MGMQLCKSAYEDLIKEDLVWIKDMMEKHDPHLLEGKHIVDVLKCSVCLIYGEQTSLCNRLTCKTPKRKDTEQYGRNAEKD